MTDKLRLDKHMVYLGLVATRSQAESWIRLGKVTVNGKVVTKPGFFTDSTANVKLLAAERYVSRAGLKLASVAQALGLSFTDKVVLDVGSSTGGFTDYALQHGARKVIAVDVGTDQMHPSLRDDKRVELHEKTDIRSLQPVKASSEPRLSEVPDIIVIDVSFVSLRQILPHLVSILSSGHMVSIVAMVKPQFEATHNQLGGSGVVKNDAVRRQILRDFEMWVKQYCVVAGKADSQVSGAHGNLERFYLLHKVSQ